MSNRRRVQILPSVLDSILEATVISGTTGGTVQLSELVNSQRGISYGVIQRQDDVADGN